MDDVIAFLKDRSIAKSSRLSPEHKGGRELDAPSALMTFKDGLIPVIFASNATRTMLENPGTMVLFVKNTGVMFRARQYEAETEEAYVAIAYADSAYTLRTFPQGTELRIDAYEQGKKQSIASLVDLARSLALAEFSRKLTHRSDVIVDASLDDERIWIPSRKIFGLSPLGFILQDGTPLRKRLKGNRGYCLVAKANQVLSYALRLQKGDEPLRLDAFFPPADALLGTLAAETDEGIPKGLMLAKERAQFSEEEGKLKEMEFMLKAGDVWKELA
ncbi:MAG: hypothetical protein ABIJ21_08880 [Nanoarchaeota archaeon]